MVEEQVQPNSTVHIGVDIDAVAEDDAATAVIGASSTAVTTGQSDTVMLEDNYQTNH